MKNRAATDTIKGYFYQFDLTILKLLQLKKDTEGVTVEGIEDIDIENASEETAVQCKYHSKTEYNHSVIAEPIRLMLIHYKNFLDGKAKKVKYFYHGYFKSGHSKLTLPITIEFLKPNFLTYTKKKVKYELHESLKLSDGELSDFLNVLTININASSYEKQLAQIKSLLQKQFKCDDFEAENFYYSTSLKIIGSLAIRDTLAKRKITKKSFLSQINHKQVLFNKWFVQYKGKEKLHSDLRKKYFTQLSRSPFERFFLFEVDSNMYAQNEVKDIILVIRKKWSDIGSARNPSTFCPYIFIKGITPKQLTELKSELISEGFKFKDGYDFQGSPFNIKSIIEKATYHNKIGFKVINNMDFIEPILNEIMGTKEIYQFYISKPFYVTKNTNIKHVSIQITEPNEIKSII